jgi:hypothetical protein
VLLLVVAVEVGVVVSVADVIRVRTRRVGVVIPRVVRVSVIVVVGVLVVTSVEMGVGLAFPVMVVEMLVGDLVVVAVGVALLRQMGGEVEVRG